jgi:GNAT superfamily N-acetyltransferase
VTRALSYRVGVTPAPDDLSALYEQAGETFPGSAELLHRAVENSSWVATAWDEGRLVGLARVLTDGVWAACFQELLVHPSYHHQGVGKGLFDLYETAFGHLRRQVIVTEVDWVRAKFVKRGFHDEPAALSRWRPLAAQD